MSAKRALTRLHPPGELEAEDRAWTVVRAAYQARSPARRRVSARRPIVAVAAALVAGAVALSPAGATVGRLITRALGVHHASPALFSLPAPGRLLVSGPGGTWTVAADGAARRLGPWTQASWSPHGLYVAVAAGDRLAAVDPRGAPRWTLARPAIRDPSWYPPLGYRVAYLSGHELRVVAGDGTGDHLLAAHVASVAPAWRPTHPFQLAYVTGAGRLEVRDADTGRVLWSDSPPAAIHQLLWSATGGRLVAISQMRVFIYGAGGGLSAETGLPGGAPATDAALSPDGRKLALTVGGGASNQVVLEDLAHQTFRRVLAGAGLTQVAWSPDGRWLLVSWPAANQLVFVRVAGQPRIEAAGRIAQQLAAGGRHGFPQLGGWCCTAGGAAG